MAHSYIELLQHIESNVKAAIQKLKRLHTGNLAHERDSVICLLYGCKDTYIKKLKKLLEEDEK